jgi:hypothetical protein
MNESKILDRQQILRAPSLQNLQDLRVSSHGTIFLFHPLTDLAREWMDTHCPAGNDSQYFCGALAVEARYVDDLLAHAAEDGLTV